MNLLFLQLAIIFVPGMIWERLDASYGLKNRPSEFDIVRRSFVYGLISYTITYGIYFVVGRNFDFLTVKNDAEFLNFSFADEVISASIVGFASGIIWLYVTNYKWLTRFMQVIKATKRYGDEDVWDFTFNSSQASVEYVHVRDFDSAQTIAGWVESFSETERVRELVLRDVIIYNDQGEELYAVPRLYLGRPMDKIHIEFPYVGNDPAEKRDA